MGRSDVTQEILDAVGDGRVTATDVSLATGIDKHRCTLNLLRLRDRGHLVVVGTIKQRGQNAHVYAKHDDDSVERELHRASNDWVRTS